MGLIATQPYNRSLKRLKASDEDIRAMEDAVLNDPTHGDVVTGLRGIRKARFAMGGRGKRGGGRVLYYMHSGEEIFMLLVFAKTEQADLTNDQRKLMLKLVETKE